MTDRSDSAIRADLVEKLMSAGVIWNVGKGPLQGQWQPATDREAAMIADALMPEIAPLLARAVAAEARAETLSAEVADLRKRLGAATCPVSWASGTHSPPHQCSETAHHLTRHRCACGVKG